MLKGISASREDPDDPWKTDLAVKAVNHFRRSLANIVAPTGNAASLGLKRWGSDCPYFVEKAGVSGSLSDGTFASESMAFFESVSADSVVAAMPLRKVPFGARLSSVTNGVTAYWTEQGAAKP